MRTAPHTRFAFIPKALALAVAPVATLAGCATDASFPNAAGASGRLVALADGDMMTSAFRDGTLFSGGAEREPDTITIISLPLPDPADGGMASVAQAEVPSSVLGPPRFLALTPDGMSALVLASRGDSGAPPYSGKTMGDLSREGTLTLVEISGAPDAAPTIVATMDVGRGARSLAVHPDGDLAGIVRSSGNAHELLLVRLDPRHGMWKIAELPLPEIPASDSTAPACVAFSPSGDSLAVTSLGLDQALLYELMREGGVIGLKQWGRPVPVPNFPFVAEFTPDGRHLIVASLEWGDNASHNIESGRAGSVTAIRVADAGALEPEHVVASSVTVGLGPEGLAISPDGSMIVTGNMGMSHLSPDDARRTPGSLTLLTLDAQSGALVRHAEYDCPAAPQGLAFDLNGRVLFVADFDNGVAQQWSVLGSSRLPSLEYTRLRVGIERGVHALAVAP